MSSNRSRVFNSRSGLSRSRGQDVDAYMPRQGLFDRDQAINMIADCSEDEDWSEVRTGVEMSLPPDSLDPSDQEILSIYSSTPSHSSTPLRPHATSFPRTQAVRRCTPSSLSDPITAPISTSFQTGYTNQPGQNLVALIQNQQRLLDQLIRDHKSMLSQQQEMLKKQEQLESKVKSLEGVVTSSGSDSKQKTKVTRQLSNLVSEAFDSLDEKFLPNESSLSDHNKRVKSKLLKNLAASDKFTTEQIKLAIQRKYEQIRRQWSIEQKDNCDELVENMAKASRYRARRIRKFNNRGVMVKPSERKFWDKLSVAYITEESDDSGDGTTIIEHKLLWRSQSLNAFMYELDHRYESKVKKDGGAVMAKKSRKQGSPSTSPIPPGAPKWAVLDQSGREPLESLDVNIV